jgi:transcription initiation factor IIE alpha subunit
MSENVEKIGLKEDGISLKLLAETIAREIKELEKQAGKEKEEEIFECPECGKRVKEGALFCGNCGAGLIWGK